MYLKSALMMRFFLTFLGEERLLKERKKTEAKRVARGDHHVLTYYHQADDPYSHLMLQMLPAIRERYDVRLNIHLVDPPPDWAAPERQKLIDYSRTDAEKLAKSAGLEFTDPGHQPDPGIVAATEARLLQSIDNNTFLEDAKVISTAMWSGDGDLIGVSSKTADDVATARREATEARDRQGHYLGAVVHYGGEWYWGPDRLHYLETRLAELGARIADAPDTPLYVQPDIVSDTPTAKVPEGTELHYYLSFRSPYTYIAAKRVKALADAYGAELKLRFVLPMVMRGLPVPKPKGFYIMKDVAREARRLGIPFGKIADPVGKPVERGYSILPWAIEEGRGYEFADAFLTSVWSEGVDAGSNSGMKKIVERAGLDWTIARAKIGNEDWRAIEAETQQEMLDYGSWGVPSFRVGDHIVWGQDRLWMVEDALKSIAANRGKNQPWT